MSTAVPSALLAIGALAAAAIAVLVLRATPRGAFVAWALVLFFVPVWVGATVGIFWAGITLLTVVLVIVNWSLVPLRPADGWVAAFSVVVLGLLVLGEAGLPATVTAMLEWVIPYVWGRVVLARVGTSWVTHTVATIAVVAAGLAVAEFMISFNPFVLIPGSRVPFEDWSPLQERGSFTRVEGAFGHSIALGAVLAMSSAFVVAARWRLVPKIVAVGVLATATGLTFSRTGLITLALTVALSICLLPGLTRRLRFTVAAVGIAGAAVVIPAMDAVFGTAGEEAAGSADYRTDLLALLPHVELFGNPGDWEPLVAGDFYLGYFADSVDNALLLMLLRFGYVPTLLLLATIACAVLMVLRRTSRSPAALAVTGQLPSLVVVALITQYGMFLWFCIGLAVSWGLTRDGPGCSDQSLATGERSVGAHDPPRRG